MPKKKEKQATLFNNESFTNPQGKNTAKPRKPKMSNGDWKNFLKEQERKLDELVNTPPEEHDWETSLPDAEE